MASHKNYQEIEIEIISGPQNWHYEEIEIELTVSGPQSWHYYIRYWSVSRS